MFKNTDYNSVLAKVIFLTKRNDITHKELGDAINVERRAMSGRASRNSKFKPEEIALIEKAFNINLSVVSISDNSGERQNDTLVDEKFKDFSKRLVQLQNKHNFLEREMGTLLQISEKDYIKLVKGTKEPTIAILNRIKQNFKVSIDYLMYGD